MHPLADLLYITQMYLATRDRILSPANPYYYAGSVLAGLGSPHTPQAYVWPLATAVRGITAEKPSEALQVS
jgi:uncharacterized protein